MIPSLARCTVPAPAFRSGTTGTFNECHWHRAPECGLARQAALASERARRAPGNRKATVQTLRGAVQVQAKPVATDSEPQCQ